MQGNGRWKQLQNWWPRLSVILLFVLWEVPFILWEVLEPDLCWMCHLLQFPSLSQETHGALHKSMVGMLIFFLILFMSSYPIPISSSSTIALLVSSIEGAFLILPQCQVHISLSSCLSTEFVKPYDCFSFLVLLIFRKLAICSFNKAEHF